MKLTEDDVREIRQIYRVAERVKEQEGRTNCRNGLLQDLATRFGVSERMIKYIRTGERRRGVKLSKRKAS